MKMECEICNTEFEVDTYGDGACPNCGTRYLYDEGQQLDLSDEQKEVLRQFAAKGGAAIDAKPEKVWPPCEVCGSLSVYSVFDHIESTGRNGCISLAPDGKEHFFCKEHTRPGRRRKWSAG